LEAFEMNQAMEVEKMSNLALVLVLALCMSQPLITNAWPSQRHVIHIENGLSNQTLQAYCKSGDQDLGLQHISPCEKFKWGFHINLIWGSKVYFCILSWPGGHRTFDTFATKGNIGLERWNPHMINMICIYFGKPKMMKYTCSMVMNKNIIYKRHGEIDKLEGMHIYYNEVEQLY
jgi:hypothetical protein